MFKWRKPNSADRWIAERVGKRTPKLTLAGAVALSLAVLLALFHGDHYKWGLRFTALNLTNKRAVYNFLSTFSGTHFVAPPAETVERGFHF